jgi:Rps23 Pro-64 3,4-dihydroxylase Tpa1-like proline 4-hydroxylase
MLKSLNKSTLNNSTVLRGQFIHNKPFKHIVIDDFFDQDFCQKLLDEFPEFDKKLATNENGEVGKKDVHEHISELGEAYTQLHELVQSPTFINLVENLTGIENLIFDPHYFGGGTHNNLDGQDLDPHVDFTNHPKTGFHRRLNLIVYLNKEWQKEWGGSIELHKNPRLEPHMDEIISVEPCFNRAVIFETNNISWHGFPLIDLPEDKKQLSRKSFALYYYSLKRKQDIESHSTIYVDRHLPEHIKAGHTLSHNDMQVIKTLITRRDHHLQRLYGYITELNKKTSDLKYRLLRKLISIFRIK